MTIRKKPMYRGLAVGLVLLGLILPAVISARWVDDSPRMIKVKVVGDGRYCAQRGWQDIARNRLMEASAGLEKVLNIKIEITDFEVWNHGDIDDFGALTSTMINQVDRGTADILVGFTLERGSGKQREFRKDGLTIARRGLMVKTYSGDPNQNKMLTYVIIHEMVHIFGGVHVFDGTIMGPVFDDKTELELDPLNREIVDITRNIDFKSEYASLSKSELERLGRLYRRAIQMGNHEMPTYLELGAICAQLERYDEAIEAYRQVVRQDMSAAYAWSEMGDCYREAGKINEAIETFHRAINYVAEKGAFHGKLAVMYYNYSRYEDSYDQAVKARRNGYEVDAALWTELKKHGLP